MLKRVAKLPFISSALQQASSVYLGVKGRYPLLGFVGGVAELGVRSASTAALQQAAPLLQNLETESECHILYMVSLILKWHKFRKIPFFQWKSNAHSKEKIGQKKQIHC